MKAGLPVHMNFRTTRQWQWDLVLTMCVSHTQATFTLLAFLMSCVSLARQWAVRQSPG